MESIKIPKERVQFLLGRNGRILKNIEKKTGAEILIEGNVVKISGKGGNLWLCEDIVKAIGRGFTAREALKLLQEDTILEIIPMKKFTKSKKAMARMRSRIIGGKGKSKRVIEELSGTSISVYGNSIGIIGSYDGVEAAKEAVMMLIKGARHASAYRFLESLRGEQSF